MANVTTDTPILAPAYNHYGLTNNRHPTHCCLRQADGTLWALVANGSFFGFLMKSTDNGFSWVTERADLFGTTLYSTGNVVDGANLCMFINEQFNTLDVWALFGAGVPDLRLSRFDLSDPAGDTPDTSDPVSGTVVAGGIDVVGNLANAYIFYLESTGLRCMTHSPRTGSISTVFTVSDAAGHFGVTCDEDELLDIVFAETDAADRKLNHFRWTGGFGGSAGAVTLIRQQSADGSVEAFDISTDTDGLGTLCTVWNEFTLAGNATAQYYATSIDAGLNWDVNLLSQTASHSDYTDLASGDEMTRCQVMGALEGGFMFTYTEDNADNVPKTYIRRLTTADSGATYDLQDEKEIATSNTTATDAITGARFFYPTDAKKLSMLEPGLVRVAYTVGDGTDVNGTDRTPVTFGQELLYSSAYPLELDSDTSTLTVETEDAAALLVNVNIVGSPKDNVDFFALGVTGNHTTRYKSAFEKNGTVLRFLKYSPLQPSVMDDRSAFGASSESWASCFLDPKSYKSPEIVESSGSTSSYVEQDIRKMFIPPDKFLDRLYQVNAGGYLKRTVWLTEFQGNQYEITQIVPRFINNQICYYEANAYVVGPSRDPFSRTTLPSET